jgi:hypothetical protein
MTEQDWLDCNDPVPMLNFVEKTANGRKRLLFVCACRRRIWHLLTDRRSRRAVEVEERYADGQASEAEVMGARQAAAKVAGVGGVVQACHGSGSTYWLYEPVHYARTVAWAVWKSAETAQVEAWDAERAAQCDILRDMIGNPFRAVSIDPSWRTPLIVAMAESIYEERRFQDTPILADALEEAGCQDEGILGHCRQTEKHVRGCWLVDLLTGRS